MEQFVQRLTDVSRNSAIFAPPVQRDDTTVITCSEVYVALGLGLGGGTSATEENERGSDGGSGGGGGGVAKGRPIAAIVVSPEGVRVEPIVDATRIVLAVVSTIGFVLFWIVRLLRATSQPSVDGGPSLNDFKKASR
jgi:uncharacterized spore protein YtfJ